MIQTTNKKNLKYFMCVKYIIIAGPKDQETLLKYM